MQILIAVQNKTISQLLKKLLSQAGYACNSASDSTQALKKALKTTYDLIILSAILPKLDGFAVIEDLRRLHIPSPVLMLTEKASAAEAVQALDAGADDYLAFPFDSGELLARIRALLRRCSPMTPEELRFGDLTYHAGNASIACGEQEIRLNYKESELMKLFLRFPQYILSKEELISKVWGYNAATSDNNVEAYISFLRKKLLTVGSTVTIIAIKKQGYKLISRED